MNSQQNSDNIGKCVPDTYCEHGHLSSQCMYCAQQRELDTAINLGYGETMGAPVVDDARKIEMVNHPSHYGGDTPYEVIKVLCAWLTREEMIGFLKGNVIKYTARAGKKGALQADVDKAQWYSKYLAEFTRESV